MSRTHRKDYTGQPKRDGEYLKRCPELNCNRCGTGHYKRILRRLLRRSGKRLES